MDYKEKYNKLVEAVKILQEANPSDEGIRNWVNDNVPELKESESERIRKTLIEYFNAYPKDYYQGGQKPVDKIEPKFKNGQWIVFNGLTLYVNEVVQGYYRTTSIGGISNSYDWNIDNAARLWTIQDAKPGDVLVNGDEIVIFKKNSFNEKDLSGSMFVHCSLRNKRGYWYTIGGINPSNYVPATKEQRDTLMKAMADAGYTFDFEKKELKKIDPCSDCINHKGCINCENGSLKETRKTSWSEEDEVGLGDALWAIEKARTIAKDENDMGNLWYAERWLKSLKDRVQSQPKQELDEDTQQTTWKPSKEQMDAMQMAVSYFDYSWISKEQKLLESLYEDLKRL